MTVGATSLRARACRWPRASLPTLFSQGVAVSYALSDTNADTLNDTLTATAGGRTVFTLKVNADGSWTFDLDDQLDHVDDGHAENCRSAAPTWLAPLVEHRLLPRSWWRPTGTATRSRERGQLHDRGAGRHSGSERVTVAASVEEDGMDATAAPEASGLNGNDLSTGNKEVGDTNADDEASGLAGSLSGLVTVGSTSLRARACR